MEADYIIKSNCIFDGKTPELYPGFVAVKNGLIDVVGISNQDISLFKGPETKVYEYKDKLVLPGFHDSHTHLLMAALYRTQVNLINARSEEECVLLLKEACEKSDEEDWVIGFSWYHVFWDNRTLPTKESLDRFFKDKPVFLLNAEGHGAWVNSKALEIAGITKETLDPPGGYFARDEDGEPTGFLYETAIGAASKYAFVFTEEQEKELVRLYADDAVEKGITSVNDMKPYFHGIIGKMETYEEMDNDGELIIRINAAADLLGDLDQAEVWRDKYKSDKFRVNLLKQFLDGVATTHTAMVLEEYVDAPGNYGISLSDLKAIKEAVLEGHKRGFCIRLHSCGDRSARLALDYYENAIKKYGKGECRHGIEHLELVDKTDISRFKELGVIPSVQPEHIALTQIFVENPYPMVLGKERADKTWPLKSLYESAGCLAIGSDCPVVDNNPFLEIYRAVTRVHNDGEPKGGWNPTEKLSMYEVLCSYTYGSAYGVCREDELGTLEQGKLADIIVIDRNLFSIEPLDILDAKVDLTMVGGEIVFERNYLI